MTRTADCANGIICYNPTTNIMRKIVCLLFCAIMAFCSVGTLFAQGTMFTYQGRLNDGGVAANGNYDFKFRIYDAVTNGNPVSSILTNSPTVVSNGLFVVNLDFGSGIFTGPARWLDIGVRTNGSTNVFTALVPRQQLTPAPYSIFANSASNLVGRLATTQLNGTLPQSAFSGYTNTVALTNSGNLFSGSFSGSFSGAFYGNGGGVTNVNVTNLTGVLADNQLPANTAFVNSNQTFTGANTFTGVNSFTNLGSSFKGSFFGNGLVGWIPTNGTAVQAVKDTGYLLTNSQLVTVTLPVSPSVGDIVRISGAGTRGWQIAQNANQSVLGNFSSFAGSLWRSNNVAGSQNWNSIASSADGSHLAAIGGPSGDIYTSSDSGASWGGGQKMSANWRSIASSADGTKLAAVIYSGKIYTNSGTTWSASGAPSANWVSVASSADGTKLVAVVTNGNIYTSTDSGGTWTQQDSSRYWSSVASSSDGTNLIAAVNGGGIYTSANSGVTWTPRTGGGAPASANWISVASSSDGVNLAAAVNNGRVYTSPDSGASWTLRTTGGAPNGVVAVASSADGSKLAAVVSGGGIYVSSNFGVTWTQQAYAPTKNWSAIASSADGTKLAAAVYGGDVYTSQASSQLTTTTADTSGYITGGQGSAVELQYIGNNRFMPVSSVGIIWAY
jgi:hypothetical protein